MGSMLRIYFLERICVSKEAHWYNNFGERDPPSSTSTPYKN